MQQYFIKEDFNINNEYVLNADDSNHIVRIMRKQIDDKIYVVFNDEIKYICNIVNNDINGVVVKGYEKVDTSNELPTKITVAIPPLKQDKLEYLVQKLTELGVAQIVLFNSERNIAKIKQDKVSQKLKRWEKIIKEAAEQSKRNLIPDIIYVASMKELINYAENYNYKVVAYEKESNNKENINLKQLLNADLKDKNIIAVFGSEGGLSEKEVEQLSLNNYNPVGLGKRILRAETAPLYLVSCIAYFAEFN